MVEVSVIIPIFNGEKWINNCMKSLADQTALTQVRIEVVVCNDGSTDDTATMLNIWKDNFHSRGVVFTIVELPSSNGVGAAKNAAVKASKGLYLCFQDIDDVMLPERISLQLEAAQSNKNAIVGSRITRNPPNSTPRLVSWANELEQKLLKIQIYTSNGPTLLMPTWFCHRSVFDRAGGFSVKGKGTPEDLLFFYAHLSNGGDLIRVDKELIVYTYHEAATTFSISREVIFKIQLKRIEECVLSKWKNFTIWNAGKAGRKIVRALSHTNQQKITAFCDVDQYKIGREIELYCPKTRTVVISLPVLHFTEAKLPFLVCVKLGLTNGEFEKNLKSLNVTEGKDFVLFC